MSTSPDGAARVLDRSGMLGKIAAFGDQLLEAERLAARLPKLSGGRAISQVVAAGMGGSAIGADLVRSYVLDRLHVPFLVNRHYALPASVNRSTLLVVSSYSGDTEETLAAYHQGLKRGARLFALTSGGWLLSTCRKKNIPHLAIPSGYAPRAALAFSFVPLLKLLGRAGLLREPEAALREAAACVREATEKRFGPLVELKDNLAKQVAASCHGRLVVIYAGQDVLETVAFRWRTQIEENAKALASHHILPEMNHNEIVGWKHPGTELSRMTVLFLRDAGDHPRVKLRLTITKGLIEKTGATVRELAVDHRRKLARLLQMLHLGDYVSAYLALLYEEDPTPVDVIAALKGALSRT